MKTLLLFGLSTFLLTIAGCGLASSDGGWGGQCVEAEDCDLMYACVCEDGPPVNARACHDGTCAGPNDTCDGFCDAFDTEWTGAYLDLTEEEETDSVSESSYVDDDEDSSTGSSYVDDVSGASCSEFFAANSCGFCGESACCPEAAACNDSWSCSQMPSCIVACVQQGASQSYCTDACMSEFSSGASAWSAYENCMDQECWNECH